LRREKTREGSLKSSSKDTDTFHHNTSASSIISNSHQFSKSKNLFNNNSSDNINKATFPMKPSGKYNYFHFDKKNLFFI